MTFDFDAVLGINESYEMPEKLMSILMSDQCTTFYDKLMAYNPDLSTDILRDYFQKEHGDRGKLKQDYTPDCICKLISRITGPSDNTLDICAGTGALTIGCGTGGWHRCEEVSTRAIPVLLLNLGIRGMHGEVACHDVLTNKTSAFYRMEDAGRYTIPKQVNVSEEKPKKWKRIISNPPYSLKWEGVKEAGSDPRFIYGLTPPKFSDFLFVQDALSRLDDNGILIEVLPHGVLFRGKKEEEIRMGLVKANMIDAVIGLPDHLFMNTDIPICLLILKKNRNKKDILFIDASKECIKDGKNKIITSDGIERISGAYKLRRNVERFAHVATLEELNENGYNMNIPRYVDTYVPEPPVDIEKTMQEICDIDKEIQKTNKELFAMAKQLTGTTPEAEKKVKSVQKKYENLMLDLYGKS